MQVHYGCESAADFSLALWSPKLDNQPQFDVSLRRYTVCCTLTLFVGYHVAPEDARCNLIKDQSAVGGKLGTRITCSRMDDASRDVPPSLLAQTQSIDIIPRPLKNCDQHCRSHDRIYTSCCQNDDVHSIPHPTFHRIRDSSCLHPPSNCGRNCSRLLDSTKADTRDIPRTTAATA